MNLDGILDVTAIIGSLVALTSFLADLLTAILGGLALWGLVFRRTQLTHAFRALASAHLNQRVNRIKETLGRLEPLSWDAKDHRSEIRALFGQLLGQVRPLVGDHDEFADPVNKLEGVVDGGRLTEGRKRQLVYELHAVLDAYTFRGQEHTLRGNNNE